MDVNGKTALVTGGASGLGEATARRLAAAGAMVAVADRNGPAARRAAVETVGIAVVFNVTDTAEVEGALELVAAKLGSRPRIVVNCAGIGLAARILPGDGSLSLDLFEHILRVNLIDTYTVLSVAARAMASLDPLDEDGARGVIVNTASVAYQDGQIGRAAYAASNGGVAALTLPAARELAQFGMRVMTIALGLFGSGMSAGLTPEVGSAIQAGLPFPKRMGRPGEYAMLVQQIVENPILNGEVIHIDSAVRLAPK